MKIYIIRAGNTNYYKIGFSTDADKRLKDLQTGCPFRLYKLVECEGNLTYEKMIHDYFNEYKCRNNGEWFEMDIDVLNNFVINLNLNTDEFKEYINILKAINK